MDAAGPTPTHRAYGPIHLNLKENVMYNNIALLNHLLGSSQYGFVKVTETKRSTRTVYEPCNCDVYEGSHEIPNCVTDEVKTTLVEGLLRNYTVRENDVLLTVLPWDDKDKSFGDKRQFTFDRRDLFTADRNGTSLVKLASTGAYEYDLFIELRRWSPSAW
jgi:hypothetical protein